MDRSSHVTLGGFLAGMTVGFGAGWLWAVVRRAWRDYEGAKRGAAAAGKSAWARTRETVVLLFFLAVAGALVLGGVFDQR